MGALRSLIGAGLAEGEDGWPDQSGLQVGAAQKHEGRPPERECKKKKSKHLSLSVGKL